MATCFADPELFNVGGGGGRGHVWLLDAGVHKHLHMCVRDVSFGVVASYQGHIRQEKIFGEREISFKPFSDIRH